MQHHLQVRILCVLQFVYSPPQHINFARFCLTSDKTCHNLVHPSDSFSTRCTLATTLMLIEFDEAMNTSDDVAIFAHHNQSGSSKTTLTSYQVVKIHQSLVANIFRHERCRRTTRNDRKKVVPSTFPC